MKKSALKKVAVLPLGGIIRIVRGQKVILDKDLADLYDVSPIALRQQVKRNAERFPAEFMFQILEIEAAALRAESAIESRRHMGGSLPLVFTQEGVAMLSSVLRSSRAVQMNILIMRAFVRLRELIVSNKELAERVAKLERNHHNTGTVIKIIAEDIKNLEAEIHWIKNPPLKPKRIIGFFVGNDMEVNE